MQFVVINGMSLTAPPQLYSLLWSALRGEELAPTRAAAALDAHFMTGQAATLRMPVTVLLVDELDGLVNRGQGVLYSLFNWAVQRHARLVIIGVANTMDLPERLLPKV